MKKAELEAEVARLREENANLKGQLAAKDQMMVNLVAAVIAPFQKAPSVPLVPVWPNPNEIIKVNPVQPWIDPNMRWFGPEWQALPSSVQ